MRPFLADKGSQLPIIAGMGWGWDLGVEVSGLLRVAPTLGIIVEEYSTPALSAPLCCPPLCPPTFLSEWVSYQGFKSQLTICSPNLLDATSAEYHGKIQLLSKSGIYRQVAFTYVLISRGMREDRLTIIDNMCQSVFTCRLHLICWLCHEYMSVL